MDRTHAQRLIESLSSDALVLDVGGGASAFPRADYVIDFLPFERRNFLGELGLSAPRYTEETWVQWDVCERRSWPFADGQFDFATCSHLLEDVRDPLWVCSELQRVAKAGYIEVPSRVLEQTRGIEHPGYCGYTHHHWMVNPLENGLGFQFKLHRLHVLRDAWVASLGVTQALNPKYSITVLEWKDSFEFRQDRVPYPRDTSDEMIEFAQKARQLPELTVPSGYTGLPALKRWVYWNRLRRGDK